MQKLEFQINIHASKEKVWNCLWDVENYKKWTNEFCEGSYFKTNSLSQGNTIHFLTPSGVGMFSTIDTCIENKKMIFKHLGEIKDFQELPINEKTKLWSGALESYELIEDEEFITIKASFDTIDEYVDFMNKTFPKALEALKKISEN